MFGSQYSSRGRGDGSVCAILSVLRSLCDSVRSMCRDILNTCVRNTEEAERAVHAAQAEGQSGRGQGKGVWMMIEESELAKTFRQDEQKKVDAPGSDARLSPLALETDRTDEVLSLSSPAQKDSDVMVQARSCKTELDDYLARTPSSSTSPVSPSAELNPELEKRARSTLKALSQMIEASDDPARLEELLSLNDDLTTSLSRFSFSGGWKRTGLGIHVKVGNETLDVVPNGHAVADEEQPSTPRIDKGKGRAEPEPEKPELVLSPTLGGAESDEEEPEPEGLAEHVSPTDRYVVLRDPGSRLC